MAKMIDHSSRMQNNYSDRNLWHIHNMIMMVSMILYFISDQHSNIIQSGGLYLISIIFVLQSPTICDHIISHDCPDGQSYGVRGGGACFRCSNNNDHWACDFPDQSVRCYSCEPLTWIEINTVHMKNTSLTDFM